MAAERFSWNELLWGGRKTPLSSEISPLAARRRSWVVFAYSVSHRLIEP